MAFVTSLPWACEFCILPVPWPFVCNVSRVYNLDLQCSQYFALQPLLSGIIFFLWSLTNTQPNTVGAANSYTETSWCNIPTGSSCHLQHLDLTTFCISWLASMGLSDLVNSDFYITGVKEIPRIKTITKHVFHIYWTQIQAASMGTYLQHNKADESTCS